MIHSATYVSRWRTGSTRPIALTLIALTALGIFLAAALLGAQQMIGAGGPTGIIQYRAEAGLFAVRPDGRATDQLVSDFTPPTAPAEEFPSPDGAAVAFVQRTDADTWLAVQEVGDVRQVAQIAAPGDPRLVAGTKLNVREVGGVPLIVAWSPDGRYLAYGSVTGLPYTLNVVERGVWTPQQYTLLDGFVGGLAWSPDGHLLAVSSYSEDGLDHTVYLLEPEDRRLTRSIDGCAIVWSPDSRYFALHRDPHREPGLWVLSVDDGAASVVSADPDAVPLAWVAE